MSEQQGPPHVVVVGAGYAGAHAARAALDAGATVTVVDASGRHDFGPRLAAVAGGTAAVGDAWADIDTLLDVRVVRGAVTAVETGRRTVAVGPDVEVTYDALVLTVGAEPAVPPVPDAHDGTLTLRSADDAVAVRSALQDTAALVVVGGGATGVQLAGEAALAHPDLSIHVVEREPRLLPGFRGLLGSHAARILRRRGVRIHLSTAVAAVRPDGIELDDGRVLHGLVVWAAGFAASGNRLLPHVPAEDGRLVVDRYLRVAGHSAVFAAGDVAHHRDLLGRPLRMSAQVARQAGKVAGRNAARAARRRAERSPEGDLSPAVLFDLGWLIGLGGAGVARIGPLPLAAPLLDRVVPYLHDAVDVRHLYEVGGMRAVLAHAPGRHHPSDGALDGAGADSASA